MKLSDLHPAVPRIPRKRVGRGDGNGHGGTCGRGNKGQKARSGSSIRPHFEGGQIPLIRRLPKRGFKCPTSLQYTVVNLYQLEKSFQNGEEVSPQSIIQKGIVSDIQDGLKILGNGELTKKLVVYAHAFSASAQEKIEKQGGVCHTLPPKVMANVEKS